MVCKGLFLILLVLSTPTWAGSEQGILVKTVDQFKVAMNQHRVKVKLVALDILKRFGSEFEDIKPEYLIERIDNTHDVGKMDPKISRELYEYWGVDIGKLPTQEQAKARRVIDDLNRFDEVRARQFNISHGFMNPDGSTTALGQKYKKVEELADLIDRGLAPLSHEEFGKEMTPASQWLKDTMGKRIALFYETHRGAYDAVVKGRHYENVRNFLGCHLKEILRPKVGRHTMVSN